MSDLRARARELAEDAYWKMWRDGDNTRETIESAILRGMVEAEQQVYADIADQLQHGYSDDDGHNTQYANIIRAMAAARVKQIKEGK